MDRFSGKQRRGAAVKIVVLILGATLAAAMVAFGVTALLININERKQEARNPFMRVAEVTDQTIDPAVWGRNFPQQYDQYLKTVDMQRTRFGGSEAEPHTPETGDPRSVVSQDKLQEDPRLKKMWLGYAFSIDFREERGHAYMLEDQTFTGRHAKPQAGACLHCHASTYVPYKLVGGGDLIKGFEEICALPYAEAKAKMEEATASIGEPALHPVACIDCHDPETMQLRVTRPGFLEGIRAHKEAVEGIEDYDPNTMATRQEMRTFVCGQCHVEYYFKGEGKRLTYPWTKGLKADEILAYYDEIGFKDWTHATTGAPMLKAQHPEFEMWNQGIHARSGVSCADCHMPYMRVGAMKISDHHVRSPLLNINNACQTCHNFPEAEMKARAEKIQQTTYEIGSRAMDALMDLIDEIDAAAKAGVAAEKLEEARQFHRKASFLIDYCEAENSTGFHAPQEYARVLSLALDYARKGQLVLRAPNEPPAQAVAAAE
jgi:nitrite reductase (cytochrome c-552)